MKNLCVTFEEWCITDGTYPPLAKGQDIELSLGIQLFERKKSNREIFFLRQLKHSDYEFCGQIVWDFSEDNNRIIVVDCRKLLFYVEFEDKSSTLLIGEFLYGRGQLFADHGIWDDCYNNIDNAPAISSIYKITRISRVKNPDNFINKFENGFSTPTSLSSNNYDDRHIEEIDAITEKQSSISFFLLDLTL